MKRYMQIIMILVGCSLIMSCAERPKATTNLDRVLEIFIAFLESKSEDIKDFERAINAAQTPKIDPKTKAKDMTKVVAVDPKGIIPKPLRTLLQEEGSIVGFLDGNRDGKYTAANRVDRAYFTIEIDIPNERILVWESTGKKKYYRDSEYRRSGGVFIWVSHMSTRQRGYYGGKPKSHGNPRMSKKGYFKKTNNSVARSIRSRSLGSRGGSRSFTRGK